MTAAFTENLFYLLLMLMALCAIGAVGAFVCDWLEVRR